LKFSWVHIFLGHPVTVLENITHFDSPSYNIAGPKLLQKLVE